jgi:hypothetical protein
MSREDGRYAEQTNRLRQQKKMATAWGRVSITATP